MGRPYRGFRAHELKRLEGDELVLSFSEPYVCSFMRSRETRSASRDREHLTCKDVVQTFHWMGRHAVLSPSDLRMRHSFLPLDSPATIAAALKRLNTVAAGSAYARAPPT